MLVWYNNNTSRKLKMGYLSQRKNRTRFNLFLNLSLTLLACLVLLPFVMSSNGYLNHVFSSYRFQYYILTLLMAGFSLYGRFTAHAFMFFVLFLLNYFSISSNSNIFFSSTVGEAQNVRIVYFNDIEDVNEIAKFAQGNNVDIIALNNISDNPVNDHTVPYIDFHNSRKSAMLSRHMLSTYGNITLSNQYDASYISYRVGKGNIIIINVDLAGVHFNDQDLIFKNLGDFILRQYSPVVVIGDFGISAYTPTFKNFLIRTELTVKNRILFKNWKGLVEPPTINILGHSNAGLSEIISLSQGINSPAAFLFTIQAY